MVSIDDLQKPSTGMSKIIVAIGIGLFSLLILNIFNILSFWMLTAVLVGVALVLKFGAPSIGTVVVLVFLGFLVVGIAQSDFFKGVAVFQPDVFKGLDGWESSGGAEGG